MSSRVARRVGHGTTRPVRRAKYDVAWEFSRFTIKSGGKLGADELMVINTDRNADFVTTFERRPF